MVKIIFKVPSNSVILCLWSLNSDENRIIPLCIPIEPYEDKSWVTFFKLPNVARPDGPRK